MVYSKECFQMIARINRQTLIIGLFLSCMALSAQEYPLEGKILDNASLAALPNVNIIFTGSRMGCTTDQEGRFYITLDTLPVNMIISHVGYKTKKIWLDKPAGPFTILLEPSPTMLGEVEIRGKTEPVVFFKDEKYAVLDYEIDNELVYLLIFKYHIGKSSLLCMTLNGDTIATSAVFPFKPIELYNDCLGYLHVLSEDSAYQVYVDRDGIRFRYVYDIKRFDETLRKCVASTEEKMFFREESWDRLTVRFYYVDRKTKQKSFMASSRDEEKLKMLYHNPMDFYFFAMDTLPCSADDIVDYVYIRKILYKPNASVLQRVGDTFCVFNTVDGSYELYDLSGRFITQHALDLEAIGRGEWTKEIYPDPVAGLVYITSLRSGVLRFFLIDLRTGGLKQVLSVAHAFPENPRIYHNNLFYLYDVPGEGDNKHLFRQKL